jgi:dipeptidase
MGMWKGRNMMKQMLAACLGVAILAAVICPEVHSCTSMLVTRGASQDSSVIITYTCDGEFHPHLDYTPAADHKAGDSLAITEWSGEVRCWVKQVPHTYGVVGLMNEHQLAIGETTFGGRSELEDTTQLLEYWDLMDLALQRARTAREAIKVMTDLVVQYGYRSTGESFSIADPSEAWIMEMIGSGPGGSGAEWVAMKVPDGYISCHANKARIGEFPLDDSQNCLYSENVISFAVSKGYYDPGSGKAFRFCDAYCPALPKDYRYADTRVWSIFRRAAPSQEFPVDYHRAVPGASPYPLWIKPDHKLTVADVFHLMRDHYEGTPFDMTRGVDAGPFGSPDRCRPMSWTVDSVDYGWERSISTPQTGYSFVSQSRSKLPDPVGGVFWYGLDNTYTCCYVPLYCGIDAVPKSYTVGLLSKFSWESAWWVFNFVSNYANLKYSYMVPEIQAVQTELEGKCFELQPGVEKTAVELGKNDQVRMIKYLTDYSVSNAEMVVTRWKDLGEHLITKYNDGYVKNDKGRAEEKGYPEDWLREVIKSRPDQFRLQSQ